jgi:hypothetical protein
MTRSPLFRFGFSFAAATFLAVSAARAVGPLQFYSVTPCRLLDTRDPNGVTGGPALSNGVIRSFAVYGSNARACGIPSDGTVRAVSLNVTIASPTYFGHLTIWPYNTTLPGVSTINFAGAEPAIANGAIVETTVNSSFQLSARPVLGGTGGNVHLIIDITGYFKP